MQMLRATRRLKRAGPGRAGVRSRLCCSVGGPDCRFVLCRFPEKNKRALRAEAAEQQLAEKAWRPRLLAQRQEARGFLDRAQRRRLILLLRGRAPRGGRGWPARGRISPRTRAPKNAMRASRRRVERAHERPRSGPTQPRPRHLSRHLHQAPGRKVMPSCHRRRAPPDKRKRRQALKAHRASHGLYRCRGRRLGHSKTQRRWAPGGLPSSEASSTIKSHHVMITLKETTHPCCLTLLIYSLSLSGCW